MLIVALLHSIAEFDQVFIAVDDITFDRLSGSRVVLAVVESYPDTPVLVAFANFRPSQTIATTAAHDGQTSSVSGQTPIESAAGVARLWDSVKRSAVPNIGIPR